MLITDSAVIRPVRGFSDGTFSIVIVRSATSDTIAIVCVFLVTAGSAQISTSVRSGPGPASDSAAATFRFAGKSRAASRAVPAKTRTGSVSDARSTPLASIPGAPASR